MQSSRIWVSNVTVAAPNPKPPVHTAIGTAQPPRHKAPAITITSAAARFTG
jgi:hypothetical protein